jgi:hypothetical protein
MHTQNCTTCCNLVLLYLESMRTENCTTPCNLSLLYTAHIIMQFLVLVLQGRIVGDCFMMKSLCARISKPKVRNINSSLIPWIDCKEYLIV